jgi:hypothetical protein
MTDMPPMVKWTAAVIAGGGIAGVTQGVTATLRANSTVWTGGLGNFMIATAELGGALFRFSGLGCARRRNRAGRSILMARDTSGPSAVARSASIDPTERDDLNHLMRYAGWVWFQLHQFEKGEPRQSGLRT